MALIDRQRLRATYTSFPTGVTVVTTTDSESRRWGMTASSFYSISLFPPLISISLTNGTASYDAFVGSGEFAVSILSSAQAGMARQFATPMGDKFSGIGLEETPYRSPVLSGSSAWLICRPARTIDIGDHTLLIGEVIETRVHDRAPLVYNRGTFFDLADPIEDESVRLRNRGTRVGFIVEHEQKIALVRDPFAAYGLTLPMGRLRGGSTNAEALAATAERLIGVEVEPDFLYSVIDLNDELNCMIYRGQLRSAQEIDPEVQWFDPDAIPWEDIAKSAVRALLRRYLTERVVDQFGVFVNVGPGRIATIASEQEWLPEGQPM